MCISSFWHHLDRFLSSLWCRRLVMILFFFPNPVNCQSCSCSLTELSVSVFIFLYRSFDHRVIPKCGHHRSVLFVLVDLDSCLNTVFNQCAFYFHNTYFKTNSDVFFSFIEIFDSWSYLILSLDSTIIYVLEDVILVMMFFLVSSLTYFFL